MSANVVYVAGMPNRSNEYSDAAIAYSYDKPGHRHELQCYGEPGHEHEWRCRLVDSMCHTCEKEAFGTKGNITKKTEPLPPTPSLALLLPALLTPSSVPNPSLRFPMDPTEQK